MTTRPSFALAALLAFASLAGAQQKLLTVPGGVHGGQFGTCIAITNDMNGDLHPDFLVGEPLSDAGAPGAGGIQFISGTTGAVIREQFGTEPGEAFGSAVCVLADFDLDGFNEYAVGAPFADAGGLVDSGRVTLFDGKTGAAIRTWSGAAAFDHFGASLSRHPGSSNLVVGAPGRDVSGLQSAGAVYLFSSASTTPIHEWQGGAQGAQLGFTVEAGTVAPIEIDGVGASEIVAGAPGWSTGASGSGRVQIFKSDAPFTVLANIDGATANGGFGTSIAGLGDLDGDGRTDLAIGEPFGGAGEGRVRIVSGATSATLKTLALPGGHVGDRFGTCVAWGGGLSGGGAFDVLVGAPFHSFGGVSFVGTVAAFSSATGAVVHTMNGTDPLDTFGMAIVGGFSLNLGDPHDFIVCAPNLPHLGERVGEVIQFAGATGAKAWSVFGPVVGNRTGAAVAGIGDVDADGIDDWVVGSPALPSLQLYSGATGIQLTMGEGPTFSSYSTLAPIGDVNLDGIPDFAEGAPFAPNQEANPKGTVNPCSGTGTSLFGTWVGNQFGDRYGAAIAGAGDLDGDGVPDVIIGAPMESFGALAAAGRVEVRSGATGAVILSAHGTVAGGQLGFSVASAGGDFNGDGIADVLVGAPGEPTAGGSGRVYVIAAPGTVVATLFDSNAVAFGTSVAGAGDLNGDGKPDLVVGAPQTGMLIEGRVIAYSGANLSTLWVANGSVPVARLGSRVAAIGDLDLDGAREIAVGEAPSLGAAVVRILAGRTGKALANVSDPAAGASFGASIARVGDLDGDGLDDLLVGEPHSDATLTDGGAAHVFSTGLLGTETFGTGTPGCAGTMHSVLNGLPHVGSTSLQVRTDHAPASSLGLVVVSNVQDLAGTDDFGLGVLMHIGILGATLIDGFNTTSDATGHGGGSFSIPNFPGLVGQTLTLQTIWSWGSACSLPPFGLSSSRGLEVTFLP